MAAFFARVGISSKFHRTSTCFKPWRISTMTNKKVFSPWSQEISVRNYVTEGLTKRTGTALAKSPGSYSCKGVSYGSLPWNVQVARCLSGQSSSGSSELLENGQSTNPFIQQSAPETLLDNEMLKDMADAMTSLGEQSLVSLGLGGYSPTGLIQQTLELIHVSGNVSWCASIAILTVIIRLVCLPLIVKAQANTAKLNNIKPQIEEVQAQLRELANSYDAAAKATASLRLKQLYQEHGCHPVKSILAPLVQIPLFVSFFLALRKMAYLPVDSFKTGGYLWFQDLTAFDPYFVLPVICSFSMLASIELGTEMGVHNPAMKTMKTIMRILAVAMIPLTAQFPTAIFSYWVTSNLFTIGQVALLKHPAARKAMGIPEMITHPSSQDPGGFWENMKAGYKNSQEVAYIKHAEKMKHQRQKALGEAPLEPTYEFNPRIKANMEMFHDDAQADQLNDNLGIPGQKAYVDPDFKPKRVKFNQEIFSAQMHRKVKKEQRKKRDQLRNRPGATM
ncbi:mitochondrial inner membrane protein OXA1L-like [Porites lutea]|uniref:mitochondrial inner membrane protein OXA1L-like n=1 Tax=Porites lutea TaxID=51062 RepID=UPI003CC5A83E